MAVGELTAILRFNFKMYPTFRVTMMIAMSYAVDEYATPGPVHPATFAWSDSYEAQRLGYKSMPKPRRWMASVSTLSRMSILLTSLLVSLPQSGVWAAPVNAPSATLLKDINPGAESAFPDWFIEINGTLYFTADDGQNGDELWKSDGTSEGTELVKDINPGPDSSSPSLLTEVNGTLFFVAGRAGEGAELWKSDGTPDGTVLVKDIISGEVSSSPNNLINANGTLYFVARVDTGFGGRQLLKSDGTEEGTVLINDGTVSGSFWPPKFAPLGFSAYMTLFQSQVYFVAEVDNGSTGFELWKTDGTALGTVIVKDINDGPPDSSPSHLIDVGGILYFGANDGDTGTELWASDGTEAGTMLIKDIRPGLESSLGVLANQTATSMTEYLGLLFFVADDGVLGKELWVSDGTREGTQNFEDLNPLAGDASPDWLTQVNGTLFYAATDGVNGRQLWKSDGFFDTQVVRVLLPGASPAFLTAFDDQLIFRDVSALGAELWMSDGTSDGTILIEDINPGRPDAFPAFMTNVGGTLLFSADDGGGQGNAGRELWRVDCPRAGGVCGAPIVVNSIGDLADEVLDGACATGNLVGDEPECTLRAAIQESNFQAEKQEVRFNIPVDQVDDGLYVIKLGSSLPIITDPAVYDATSQPGYQPEAPVVEIQGPGIASPVAGFRITAGNTTIRGFSMYGLGRNGILISDRGGNRIEANMVGTGSGENAVLGIGEDGILIRNSSDNVIGSSTPVERNVISRNGLSGTGGCGIKLEFSSDNHIIGNLVGTDVTGTERRANGISGICLFDSGFNTIGGAGNHDGNVISGNTANGIDIQGQAAGANTILNNVIGLDVTGDGELGNGRNGIEVDQGGGGNVIGDALPTGRNIISGNANSGILIDGGEGFNTIDGNFIGTDAAGASARPNQTGITIRNSPMNRIGVDGGNVISGNTEHGIFVTGEDAAAQIQDNYVGTDLTGFNPLANGLDGVRLGGARNTIVTSNVISNNGGNGVSIFGADELGVVNPSQGNADNAITSNWIGADPAGQALGNGGDGVAIRDTSGNRVGSGNLIRSNGSAGITVVHLTFGAGNVITGNEIHSNIALGIDLGSDFVTANDDGDDDEGANRLQNFPEITSVTGSPLNLVQGTLTSTANTSFTIELFSNAAADPSGFGEGEVFEGAFPLTTDATGMGSFIGGFGIGEEGGCITATARDNTTDDTSEFSTCETIPPPPLEPSLDFGDAPDMGGSYPTLLTSNGARHVVDLGAFMGSRIDGDPDGQPNEGATGDDDDGSQDERGVTFVSNLKVPSDIATVEVLVNAMGFLDAWIDFNGDADWYDDDDRIFDSIPLVPGVNVLNFDIPSNAKPGQSYARFRFSTLGGLAPLGPALNGEVEDYVVEIQETPIFRSGFE